MIAPAPLPVTCQHCSRPRDVCCVAPLHEPEYQPGLDGRGGSIVAGPTCIQVEIDSHGGIWIHATPEDQRALVGWRLDCTAPSDAVVGQWIARVMSSWRDTIGDVEQGLAEADSWRDR